MLKITRAPAQKCNRSMIGLFYIVAEDAWLQYVDVDAF